LPFLIERTFIGKESAFKSYLSVDEKSIRSSNCFMIRFLSLSMKITPVLIALLLSFSSFAQNINCTTLQTIVTAIENGTGENYKTTIKIGVF
jgi:hypothetical protein